MDATVACAGPAGIRLAKAQWTARATRYCDTADRVLSAWPAPDPVPPGVAASRIWSSRTGDIVPAKGEPDRSPTIPPPGREWSRAACIGPAGSSPPAPDYLLRSSVVSSFLRLRATAVGYALLGGLGVLAVRSSVGGRLARHDESAADASSLPTKRPTVVTLRASPPALNLQFRWRKWRFKCEKRHHLYSLSSKLNGLRWSDPPTLV